MNFEHRDKYNLCVGQIFKSCSELAKQCNVSNKTISQWMKKQWIEKR